MRLAITRRKITIEIKTLKDGEKKESAYFNQGEQQKNENKKNSEAYSEFVLDW